MVNIDSEDFAALEDLCTYLPSDIRGLDRESLVGALSLDFECLGPTLIYSCHHVVHSGLSDGFHRALALNCRTYGRHAEDL